MRSSAFVLVTALAACGGASGPTGGSPDAAPPDGDGSLPPPARGFQIKTPTIDLDPRTEVTFCYYFHTPNKTDLSIQKWASHMTAGSHHMILLLTPTDQQTPGTLSTFQCGFANGSIGALWTYSAQTLDAETALPGDDGSGVPVGQLIKARQPAYIQMYYQNPTDDVIQVHVELNAYAYDEGVQVTPAGPFVAFNNQIDLAPGTPANPTPGMVNGTCTVPSDSTGKAPKFYRLTTHTHKQGVHTVIKDGTLDSTAVAFDSTSWEHPGQQTWTTDPFFGFASGKLSYQCEYMNPNNYRIQTGDSAATEEMCVAIGYFFPATGGTGHYCLNSTRLY